MFTLAISCLSTSNLPWFMDLTWTIYLKLKNWCFWPVVLEKTLESLLNCKESKPVNPKGNQSWIFIARTDADTEATVLWPPDAKNWLIGKDPDAGKDWRQEKGMAEEEMVGWHHWLYEHEFEQLLGVGDGQGSPACCNPWGHKESDTIEQLNCTDGPDIPGSCAILFFTASNFSFTTRHIHNWASFLLWPSLPFFLELFFHSFSVHFGHLLTWSLIFWCHVFLPFHTVHRILEARILEWFAIPFASECFVRTLYHDLSFLGSFAWQGPSLQVTQGCGPHDHFG